MTNVDLETVHDTSDEWIRSRTGISQRRLLVHEGTREVNTKAADAGEGEEDDAGDEPAPRETLRTPGIDAATNAPSLSGINPSDINLVICATSSPDNLFGDVPYVAHAVGCNSARCAAFDLTAACSGFLFGIVRASQFRGGGGGARNALVPRADALTRWVD